jgi:hypothetical protein
MKLYRKQANSRPTLPKNISASKKIANSSPKNDNDHQQIINKQIQGQ